MKRRPETLFWKYLTVIVLLVGGVLVASGIAEIAGGLATMHPATRRAGSAWSIATLIAVFPANLHMALNHEDFEEDVPGGQAALWGRLPVQLLFIAWAYAAGDWDEN